MLVVKNTFLHYSLGDDGRAMWRSRSAGHGPSCRRGGGDLFVRGSLEDVLRRCNAPSSCSAGETSQAPATDSDGGKSDAVNGDERTKAATSAPTTTVIVKNLPGHLTRDDFVALVAAEGFDGEFDFIYLPRHFGLGHNFGYAFINLCTGASAERFLRNFGKVGIPDNGGCVHHPVPGWGTKWQGFEANVNHYRNSPLMHPQVPDELKPAIFAKGARVSFPEPTRRLHRPKNREPKGGPW